MISPAMVNRALRKRDGGPAGVGAWSTIPLKRCVDRVDVRGFGAEACLGLDLENLESGTGRLASPPTPPSDAGDARAFSHGDVLFGKLRPYLAKVFEADFDGVCSSELLVLRPRRVTSRFLTYWLLSQEFLSEAVAHSYGTKMPRVEWEQLGLVTMPVPPLPAQRIIAAFLDRETARIDALVAKNRELLRALEEKRAALVSEAMVRGLDADAPRRDSGTFWIGEIPSHWQVIPLKRLCRVRGGVAKGRDLAGGSVVVCPYLRVANVQSGYLDLSDVDTIEVLEHEVHGFSLRRGDVLMNEGGDFDKLGRGFVWEAQIEPCLHQNHVFAVRPNAGVDPYWISMATMASYMRHYFILRSKQSTNLASISATNLSMAPIVWAPLEEQGGILGRVRDVTGRMDSDSERIQTATGLLKEYRAALISAAVTGEIDVRGDVDKKDYTSTQV